MRSIVALFALFLSFAGFAQNAPFPPSPKQLIAVNPITNKVYVANESANTVTALDVAKGTSKTITVGSRPQFIAVNPLTNRVYVNNGGEASLSVLDGANDTNLTPTPLAVGSQGPIAINAETNIIYIVRMTSVATDEVTFFNGADNTWYTIATESFQPTAVAVNPVTNTLYVAHYGTGDVRVISAAFNPAVLHPTTFSIGAWSKPFALAVNPASNKIFVTTEDSRGPIGIIDGATRTAQWLTPAAGHAAGPKSLVVNPATGVAYAAFNGEVIAISGTTLSYIPVATGTGPVGLAVNPVTNTIYVSSNSGTLTAINGDNNTTTTFTIPAGAESIAVNPVTNEAITHGPTTTFVDGVGSARGTPLTASITALAGNPSGPNPTFTLNATNNGSALPVRGVFVQMDSREGSWTAATGGGGSYSSSFSNLTPGSHTLNAFAVESQVARTATGPEALPYVSAIASYTFTVSGSTTTPGVSLISSLNPSTAGQPVTFTANVTGNGGSAPTGTVAFRDGATTITGCGAVALASGRATCTTSPLTSGNHTIMAAYSGDSNYGTENTSITQAVGAATPNVTVTSSTDSSLSTDTVTFTANVSGIAGTPTGTINFTDGATPLCMAVALSSGRATCSASLAAGNHIITASYSGNASYSAGSGTAGQSVNKRDASLTLATDVNPSVTGQAVAITATVTGSGGPAVTGTVTFSDAGTTLCSAVPVASGSATCRTSFSTTGAHALSASYSGDANFKSTSGNANQTVNAQAPAKSEITSPTPGSTLSGSSATFTWTAGSQITARYLTVGTTPNGSEIYGAYQDVAATSRTVTGLPTNGVTLYVRLFSFIGGDWQINGYTYTAANSTPTPVASSMTSPTPGSTLPGSSATFSWDPGTAVTARYLTVGTTPNGSEIYGAYQDTMSRTVTGLPTNGATLYVRLFSFIGGNWQINSYTYTAATSSPATMASSMTSPTPGSMLPGSSVTFSWDAGNGVTARYLAVGTTPNGSELYGAYQDTLSRTLTGVPTDGSTIHVRLYSFINGNWQINAYTYMAASAGPMASNITSPAPGSTLAGSSATFSWDSGSGVTARYLAVGTTPDGSEIYGAYQDLDATSHTVTGLPTNGTTVYVRLYSWIDGNWQIVRYSYVAASR